MGVYTLTDSELEEIILSDEYDTHIDAMTSEGLHSKMNIALQLAKRDILIKNLQRDLSLIWRLNNDE